MMKSDLRNIAHITVNSRNKTIYPDNSVIPGEMKPYIEKMVEQAMTSGVVSVMDTEDGSVEAQCVIDWENGVYMARLYIKGFPEMILAETAGALTMTAGKKILNKMKVFFKASWGINARPIKCSHEVFICDVLFPSVMFTPWFTQRSGNFTKCFGIRMLEMLSWYKAIKETEISSETVRDGMILCCEEEPNRVGLMESKDYAIFDTDCDGIMMKIFFDNLTQTEVKAFATAKLIGTSVVNLDAVSLLAVKIGNLNWFAVPISPRLTECLKKFGGSGIDNNIRLKLVLSDARTGKTEWALGVTYTGEWYENLISTLKKQEGKITDRNEYDMALERIYSNYSIQHVVEMIESEESEK
ncbi:MAG: hypothetical protein OSJ60_14160 [Lachnospiraceae bacterium]|nr:hypothetical protein [Lachnospiraceae bacterium]